MENMNINDLDFNLDFGNFNPDEIEVDETINAVFLIDVSSSVGAYVQDLNLAFNEFTESMQKSHIADKLLVSIIEFNHIINVVNGFMPIENISSIDFSKRIKGATALFDAVYAGLKNALNYRENLENSGVDTKTILYVITDGEDNSSQTPPHIIKKIISDLKKDERDIFSFSSVLFGIGNEADFKRAQKDMGIEHLAQIGVSGEEIKKMIGFISQSISSVSAGKSVPAF
ncbi:MAG: VWA domain-containing protein [Bacteroidales bacterium]|nr:VWA domain-containing protein [Bacteroidales bacterium]